MRRALLATWILLICVPTAQAASKGDSLVWRPSWPGTEMAVVSGDPSSKGPFSFRFRMPAGYWIHPHRHPVDARIRVLSGTFMVGMGPRLDSTKVQVLGRGKEVRLAAGMAHYEGTRGETVIEVSGNGPWGITFLNPSMDPGVGSPIDSVRRALASRYAENEAGFFARDPDRVMRLRHPAFHTITPDGKVSTREQMYQRTRDFIGRIERFDSLSETITDLTLDGDTAHAVVDQRTVRKQRIEGVLKEVRTSVVQRESWIRTPQGWLMWRVDQVRPGQTYVDGKPVAAGGRPSPTK